MRDSSPVVINPRGFRAYVRNDTFFKAIPEVIESYPEVKFICPDMASEPRAERWIQRLGIHSSVMLLPKQTRPEMAELYRKACLSVSPSEHDGTPNTLLEAMACGCFPIAGDIEPLREWIRAGENGYLIPPDDPHALAEAILNALESPQLRWQAEQQNLRLIAQKAAYLQVMDKARRFYQHLITGDSFTLN